MTTEQKITALKYETASVQYTVRERVRKYKELKKLEQIQKQQGGKTK